jgi:hypothetical protein
MAAHRKAPPRFGEQERVARTLPIVPPKVTKPPAFSLPKTAGSPLKVRMPQHGARGRGK